MTAQSNHIPSESDLIKGCIEGDPQMQRLLYQRFSSMMYGVCLRYSDNTEDANDVLQEGFIKVYKNLEKFRSEGSFEGWVRRIFINTSIEHYRKKVNMFSVTETQEVTIEDKEWNILDNLAEKDIISMIHELSPGYRVVLNMHVIQGYSHKEIADILGINEGTSKSQLARAKGALKKIIESRTGAIKNNDKEEKK